MIYDSTPGLQRQHGSPLLAPFPQAADREAVPVKHCPDIYKPELRHVIELGHRAVDENVAQVERVLVEAALVKVEALLLEPGHWTDRDAGQQLLVLLVEEAASCYQLCH